MAETVQELKDKVSSNGAGDGGHGSSGLLIPAAATVATAAAAGLVAKKGPDLLKKLKGEAGEEGEELGKKGAQGLKEGLASSGPMGKIASKMMGGGGGDGGAQKGGKTRRLPIQRWTDVAVPVEQAYEAWTKFDDFPKFMHRVLDVDPRGGDRVSWREKIWFSTREWEGQITEQRKNELIAWKTTKGVSHQGVVTFHRLDDRLTRVMVDMEFEPSGMLEKMASGLRFVKRAVQADLARFKAYVELGDAKGVEYRQDDADEPSSRERRESSGDRDEREKRRQERRQRAGSR